MPLLGGSHCLGYPHLPSCRQSSWSEKGDGWEIDILQRQARREKCQMYLGDSILIGLTNKNSESDARR